MKRLFCEFIWQWKVGPYIGFNPIDIEFEYEKFEPTMTFKIVLMGIGAQITWLCPWETTESKYAKECVKNMKFILSIGDDMAIRDRSGDA